MGAEGLNWEKKLGIKTGAAEYEKEDGNHSRYEPTSYAVLERLARSGWIGPEDALVDYGCGKGRVGFYMHYAAGCRTIGVEYDERLHALAMENLSSCTCRRGADGIGFICASAESYVPSDANCFYFFNPFSVRILQSVLGRIYESYYAAPREMRLFFYYALDDYRSCLMGEDMLSYAGEIDCRDLFHNVDEKERILIFEINPA